PRRSPVLEIPCSAPSKFLPSTTHFRAGQSRAVCQCCERDRNRRVIRKSGGRFPLRQLRSVCAEITRKKPCVIFLTKCCGGEPSRAAHIGIPLACLVDVRQLSFSRPR